MKDKKIESRIKEILDMLFVEEIEYEVKKSSSTVANTIESIEKKNETTYVARTIGGKEAVAKLINTEVQKAVEDGVRGFIEYYNKNSEGSVARGYVETYLQSLDKGDGE